MQVRYSQGDGGVRICEVVMQLPFFWCDIPDVASIIDVWISWGAFSAHPLPPRFMADASPLPALLVWQRSEAGKGYMG